MFLLISGGHIGAPKLYTMWRLLTNCGPQRPETNMIMIIIIIIIIIFIFIIIIIIITYYSL